MSLFKRKNRRLLILFAVALAAAAIVPVAEAAKRSTNTEQLAGWGWRPTSGKLSPSVRIITENSASQNQIALRNAGARVPEIAPTYAAPLIVDNSLNPSQVRSSGQPVQFSSENSAGQNEVALRNAAETTVSAPSSSVFDWGDAGLGAGSAVGLMLLLTAAAAFVIRRSRPRRVVL
jgi:hypothetical protein